MSVYILIPPVLEIFGNRILFVKIVNFKDSTNFVPSPMDILRRRSAEIRGIPPLLLHWYQPSFIRFFSECTVIHSGMSEWLKLIKILLTFFGILSKTFVIFHYYYLQLCAHFKILCDVFIIYYYLQPIYDLYNNS